ncbi:MAG: dockerin type I repeat-containing protein [Oscillospiraceae bacterium]|nr:dockerin type I repeat-containing protein [Oscillospiraceae bacterium]
MTKRNRTAALVSAAMMLCTVPQLPAYALDPVPAAPDWVPASYAEAVSFTNEYGMTRVDDGFICIVRIQEPDNDRTYDVQYSGIPNYDEVSDTLYSFEAPEDPGENDGSEDYWKRRSEYEDYQRNIEYAGEDFIAHIPKYEVIVVMPESVGELKVELRAFQKALADPYVQELTFAYDGRTLEETDLRAWLPDSVKEYNIYTRENGTVSVHDDLIAVCADCNYSTGAKLTVGLNGAEYEQVTKMYVSENRLLPVPIAGETSRIVEVYRPAGDVQITVFVGREWSLDYPDDETAKMIEVQPDGSLTVKEPVAGDLNADGYLGIADAVLLSKFLYAEQELNAAQIMIADLSGDRHVNAVDLTVMKRALFSEIIRIDDPVI